MQGEPRHYRSNYTFNAIEDGDLTVFEGEVVTAIPCPLDTTDDQVNNAVEDGWLLATNARGDVGKVPENVCLRLFPPFSHHHVTHHHVTHQQLVL